MKYILNHLFPFSIIKKLMEIDKETWRWFGYNILVTFLPLICITIAFNSLLLLFSFVHWTLPDSFYFPFLTGGELQGHFDRLFLAVGVMIAIFK